MISRSLLALAVLLCGSSAWAAVPNMCGSQVDLNLHTGGAGNGTGGSCGAGKVDSVLNKLHGYSTQGCVTLCPSETGDRDNDGYDDAGVGGRNTVNSTYVDCDPTRADIFPGVWTAEGCAANEARLCNANGTYGSCTAHSSIDQSTNSGGRVYVNPGVGSDGNPGTYASPFATVNFCVDSIAGAGGVCYLYGSGTDTTAVTLGASGTSSHPRRLIRLAGSTAKIAVASGIAISGTSFDDWYLDNLDVDGVTAAVDFNGASRIEGSRLYLHDGFLNGTTNHSQWRFQASDTVNLHHSIIRNSYRDTGSADNAQNVSAALYLDNESSGQGFDHQFNFNVVFNDTYDATNGFTGLYLKHGVKMADMTSDGFRVRGNIFANHGSSDGNVAISTGSSGLRAKYNRFYGGHIDTGTLSLGDGGGGPTWAGQDNRFQYNTIIRGGLFSWGNYPSYQGGESLVVDHNIVQCDKTSYGTSDPIGIISMDGYGSDAQRTSTQGGDPLLTINYNCYYSPNATPNWCYYCMDSGGHGPAGTAGDFYTFANWQNVSNVAGPQDANSFLQDPTIATDTHIAGAANCATFGWTSTTTSTTTTLATAGLPAIFPQN